MGISFGSASKKPYVGSKEVQEAYVGSQLVYQNKPPYNYAFLGSKTKYYLATWATLSGGAAIVKNGDVYNISTGTSQAGTLTLTEVHGPVIKFTAHSDDGQGITIEKYVGGTWYVDKNINLTKTPTLYSYTINTGTQFRLHPRFAGYSIYLDAVRYEES